MCKEIKIIIEHQSGRNNTIIVNPCEAITNYMNMSSVDYIPIAYVTGRNPGSKSIVTFDHDLDHLKDFMALIGYTVVSQDVSSYEMSEMLDYI